MKVYSFGAPDKPVVLQFPGTCCHWKSNFFHVIPFLDAEYRVLAVSYDGFDETEQTEFPTMLRKPKRSKRISGKSAAGVSARHPDAHSAGHLWDFWRRGGTFT